MKIAIMQPTFLPWVGYFDLIDRVDRFVYLDTVPLTRQSWQHRNRIKTAQGLQWLSLPVTASVSEKTPIMDATLGAVKAQKLRRAIEQNYARARYFKALWPRFEPLFAQVEPGAGLADLNIALIEAGCAVLAIETPRLRASSLPRADGRIERLIEMTRALGGAIYLSPMGAAAYLAEQPHAFPEAGLSLRFQGYEHPTYGQLFPPFVAGCSFLDLLFNCGPDSLGVIRSGRMRDRSAEDIFASLLGEVRSEAAA